jgi:hypothetical protein
MDGVDFPVEKRVQGDPRGPGGPPHHFRLVPLLALLASATLFAADGPRLFYSRSFPGSTPAYFQITLDKDGNAVYGEAPDDDLPLKFQLSGAETQQVFALLEKLDYFKHPVESAAKVAFMGAKTLRYENGDQKGEIKFNYTEDVAAHEMQDWFERMAESAQYRTGLERAAKYDKLGVPQALSQLWVAMEHNRLVAKDQFLPMLDRIVKNESYMHASRVRAADLAAAIRDGKPQ